MKKFFLIFASAFMLVSCMVDDSADYRRTDDHLKYMCLDFLEATMGKTVDLLQQSLVDGNDINAEGFSITGTDHKPAITRTGDNLYSVTGRYDGFEFTATIDCIPSEDLRYKWQCTEFSGTYEEENGRLRAEFSASEDMKYSWRLSMWPSDQTYTLEPPAEFYVNTYSYSQPLDRCTLIISEGTIYAFDAKRCN